MSETQSTELVRSIYTDDELRRINTMDDAFKLSMNGYVGPDGTIETGEILGNGFVVIPTTAKDDLVGVPMMILSWRVNPSTKGGDEFVSLLVVADDGGKVIVNDGGTGILRQLRAVEAHRREERPGLSDEVYCTNLFLPHGLRKSEYTYTDEKGRASQAVTFYLAS